ncbi:MAG: hypothetical protein JSV82_09435 [Planctomycetota bacterium]|nr:MAG: hypothetical protein JSV82_09435 [Planctomycetota bacterium]
MNQASLLLKAYYEALYELLEANRNVLITNAEVLLRNEIKNRNFQVSTPKKFAAYRDAAAAFLDERIETYNPIGFQYTLDQMPTSLARELELQLNWYNSEDEFLALTEAVQAKAVSDMPDNRLHQLTDELIAEMGAFPDKSIISAYHAKPALEKLPDYVVARAIEDIIST